MNIIRLAESRVVRWFGILSLVVAFIAGEIAARPDHLAQLATYLPSVQLGESEYGSTIFLVENEPDDKEKVVLLGQGEGYGGPLVVAIIASKDNNNGARIDSVHLMSNKETPPYIVRLQKKGFFRDFKNESVSDDFIVGEDLDGFSGATVSARGIAKVVRETVHAGAEKHLKIEPT